MSFILAWLDSSEHDRRRALDVIDLFDQPETVDELGLGTVRDTIADVLSPGTSTIQTRARYFFFIPWGYQRLEKRAFARGGAANAGRDVEVKLIDALTKAPDNSDLKGSEPFRVNDLRHTLTSPLDTAQVSAKETAILSPRYPGAYCPAWP